MLALKKALLIVLLLTIVGSATYVGVQRSTIPQQVESFVTSGLNTTNQMAGRVSHLTQNPNEVSQMTVQSLAKVNESATEQVDTLVERSAESGSVLGDFVQKQETAEGDEPLHEQAIEYGQYLYCKQVVEAWEK